jgi:hypothetical protein
VGLIPRNAFLAISSQEEINFARTLHFILRNFRKQIFRGSFLHFLSVFYGVETGWLGWQVLDVLMVFRNSAGGWNAGSPVCA